MCLLTPEKAEDLAKAARDAVAKHPDSHIEIAMSFLKIASPLYLLQSNDCLLKIGRRITNLVNKNYDLKSALQPLVEECDLICSNEIQVPKVRFGKTELQMPIVTLGCMRFQMEWGPRITHMNQVGSDCQDNLVAILKHAFKLGINHIETARGYGCSELQIGVALKQLMNTGLIAREDFILQTKVSPNPSADEFRKNLETSFENLQVDYVDLFAMHGLNLFRHYDWVFGKGGCWDVVQEYVAAGKIRHVGFSTHGPPDLIQKLIETEKFDYCNLHYHYFGSYTASGCGPYAGNLGNVRLANEKDMGVFVISPYDKGGAVYAPSKKLLSLTLPEMEPMAFGSAWLWNHNGLDPEGAAIHTIVCGAARPSDLDLPAVAAHLQGTQAEIMLEKVKVVTERLEQAKQEALSKEWLETCYEGISKSNQSKYCVEHNQIIWMYNVIKAFGLLGFAKNRYGSLESNLAKWDKSLPNDENINKNLGAWGYVPGLPNEEGVDYSDDFTGVPEQNMKRVLEAEEFVRCWCSKKNYEKKDDEKESGEDSVEKGEIIGSCGRHVPVPPQEWETAYDMRPWPDFPDRPLR
jgi:predicted aldo/keto reductase-like oxidoreductase